MEKRNDLAGLGLRLRAPIEQPFKWNTEGNSNEEPCCSCAAPIDRVHE
jgi:hypothetical protein